MTEHQKARKYRATARAENLGAKAAAAFESAHKMSADIPLGQPILVGHYSEGRDRRYRARITAKMAAGVTLSREADRLAGAANRAGYAIMSDDPDAIAALTAKVESLERAQAKMKAANKLVKKRDLAGLVALGFSEARAAELLEKDFCGRVGFPAFAMTNNNANIRRLRERIARLETLAVTPEMEPIAGDGWTIREDASDNRLLIEFDEKPAREMLDKLGAAGFKWSPTRGAHVRMRSNAATYQAKIVLGVAE